MSDKHSTHLYFPEPCHKHSITRFQDFKIFQLPTKKWSVEPKGSMFFFGPVSLPAIWAVSDNPVQGHSQNWFGLDLVRENHQSTEASNSYWMIVSAVTSNVATTNIFERYFPDTEAHIIPREIITQTIMVHFKLDCSYHVDSMRLSSCQVWGHLSPLDPREWYRCHQFCRCSEGTDAKAAQLDNLVGGYNPELQAVWFYWPCQLCRWLTNLKPRFISPWL